MSIHKDHDDDCPGCRPAMMDLKTGKVLPPDHPMMKIANAVWAQTTLAERQAFHRATCNNSEAVEDVRALTDIGQRIEAAIIAAEQTPN